MKNNISIKSALLATTALVVMACQQSTETGVSADEPGTLAGSIPTFRADPDWPQVPAQWKLGDVSSIAIDAEDNPTMRLPTIIAQDRARDLLARIDDLFLEVPSRRRVQ